MAPIPPPEQFLAPEQPPPSNPNPISPLLALPAEIRNQIYILLLTSPHIHTYRQLHTRIHITDDALPTEIHLSPSLLSTCHQIHDEALGILYGSNTFAAHPSLLTALPHLLSPRHPVLRGPGLRRIKKWWIKVRLDVDPRFDAADARAAFSGAEALEIDVFQAMYGSCDFSVLRLFEEVRGVGTAVVGGSTGSRAYSMWLEKTMMLGVGQVAAPFVEVEEWDAWAKGNR